MTRHRVHIYRRSEGARSRYRASCSCGWVGPETTTERASETEHDDHVLAYYG